MFRVFSRSLDLDRVRVMMNLRPRANSHAAKHKIRIMVINSINWEMEYKVRVIRRESLIISRARINIIRCWWRKLTQRS